MSTLLPENVGGFFGTILVVLCGGILLAYLKNLSLNKKLPPGPWGFPVAGHLPLLGDKPQQTFKRWWKQYGDVFRIRMGSWQTIVINGNEAVKEALLKTDDFSSRPRFLSMVRADNMKDLVFGEFTPRWMLHWKIVNKTFLQFVHKHQPDISGWIIKEANRSVEYFISTGRTPFDPTEEMQLATGSIIYQVCFGKGMRIRDDEAFLRVISINQDFIEFFGAGNPVDVMPWLRFVMPWKLKKLDTIFKLLRSGTTKQLQEHVKTFDKDNVRDITDVLLLEESLLTAEEMNKVGLTAQQLFSTVEGLIGAGFENVSTTLTWAIKLMALFPDTQRRLQKEIDEVVGPSRYVSESDHGKLPYTEATIFEILRFTAVVPFPPPHFNTKDTELKNYFIPAGTVAFINLHSLSFDESVWGDPEAFRPERFLTDTGAVNKELAYNTFFPFGLGRRRCLGESLVKIELFLFFSTFLQRCKFEVPEGQVYDTDGVFALTYRPTKFSVIASSR